jgi:hypothetical protein
MQSEPVEELRPALLAWEVADVFLEVTLLIIKIIERMAKNNFCFNWQLIIF